ncbi:acid phosphatase [Xylaria intraflava]|nr:acid phosphatase [Xylaria intraflava]
MRSLISSLLLAGSVAAQVEDMYTATGTAAVAAAAATALTESPTSHVRGKAFDRFVVIWLENTDYDMAAKDPNLAFLAKKGITLRNYYSVTHPSEPNYVAAIGGDNFGMQNDDFHQVDRNISTIVDLLEDKHISWGHYQEYMPFSGYQGFDWINHTSGANNYVRKHNPAVIYNSAGGEINRLPLIKNFTLFHEDLKHDRLPQWMFITPNMTNDGHDTSVTVAGTWTRSFLEPLLEDKRFMQNTMVLVTFDENETSTAKNNVFGFILGDAVPEHLVGTTDDNYYNHYSEISTVCANWDLHTLGRWDVGANVIKVVAEKTGDVIRPWDGKTPFSEWYFNTSYAGVFNEDKGSLAPYPGPYLVKPKHHGRTVLPSIERAWKHNSATVYYTDTVSTADGAHPPKGFAPAA